MTMKMKFAASCGVALFALGLVVAGGRSAHGPRPGPYAFGRGPMLEHIFDRLDLSSEQREQVRGVIDRRRPEIHGGVDAVRAAHAALFDRVHAEDSDETAIRDAAMVLGRAEADLAVMHASVLREARGLLTPEQQVEAARLRDEHRARMLRGGGPPHHRSGHREIEGSGE